MKQKVRKYIDSTGDTDFTGTIDEICARLKDKEVLFKEKGFENISIEIQYDYSGDYFEFWGDRIETDKEYEARLKREQKAIERQEKKLAKEKEKYEKLKAKFEK